MSQKFTRDKFWTRPGLLSARRRRGNVTCKSLSQVLPLLHCQKKCSSLGDPTLRLPDCRVSAVDRLEGFMPNATLRWWQLG